MQSIKAIYENGVIRLSEPAPSKGKSSVIVTFLDDGYLSEQESDDLHKSLRKHERYEARGEITVVTDGMEISYALKDYSAGGLSFIGDRVFEAGEEITAAIKYKIQEEPFAMDFKMTVRSSIAEAADYKTGCQFKDAVDEELWHTIMS